MVPSHCHASVLTILPAEDDDAFGGIVGDAVTGIVPDRDMRAVPDRAAPVRETPRVYRRSCPAPAAERVSCADQHSWRIDQAAFGKARRAIVSSA